MPKTYAQVEKRVNQAIDAIQMHGKVNQNKIAKEFCVPVQKFQLQFNKHPSATTVQEVRTWKMSGTQSRKSSSCLLCPIGQIRHAHPFAYD